MNVLNKIKSKQQPKPNTQSGVSEEASKKLKEQLSQSKSNEAQIEQKSENISNQVQNKQKKQLPQHKQILSKIKIESSKKLQQHSQKIENKLQQISKKVEKKIYYNKIQEEPSERVNQPLQSLDSLDRKSFSKADIKRQQNIILNNKAEARQNRNTKVQYQNETTQDQKYLSSSPEQNNNQKSHDNFLDICCPPPQNSIKKLAKYSINHSKDIHNLQKKPTQATKINEKNYISNLQNSQKKIKNELLQQIPKDYKYLLVVKKGFQIGKMSILQGYLQKKSINNQLKVHLRSRQANKTTISCKSQLIQNPQSISKIYIKNMIQIGSEQYLIGPKQFIKAVQKPKNRR